MKLFRDKKQEQIQLQGDALRELIYRIDKIERFMISVARVMKIPAGDLANAYDETEATVEYAGKLGDEKLKQLAKEYKPAF